MRPSFYFICLFLLTLAHLHSQPNAWSVSFQTGLGLNQNQNSSLAFSSGGIAPYTERFDEIEVGKPLGLVGLEVQYAWSDKLRLAWSPSYEASFFKAVYTYDEWDVAYFWEEVNTFRVQSWGVAAMARYQLSTHWLVEIGAQYRRSYRSDPIDEKYGSPGRTLSPTQVGHWTPLIGLRYEQPVGDQLFLSAQVNMRWTKPLPMMDGLSLSPAMVFGFGWYL